MIRYFILAMLLTAIVCRQAIAQSFISHRPLPGYEELTAAAELVICVDDSDVPVVKKVAQLFAEDWQRLTGKKAMVVNQIPATNDAVVIIGSINQSALINQMIKSQKINPDKIKNRWEAYQLQYVQQPVKDTKAALVITGSDRRGTAFGVFELSRLLGVSPWYWWADVPVNRKDKVFIHKTTILIDSPLVKYRGIFLNDEAPALSGWSKEKFGGFNHLFYEKVFELMLRLKSNYIWPAMWGNAFYDDDPANIEAADEYGIVIGTSHHEPLMRAHVEWQRYGTGLWNYDSNEVRLKDFWRTGMQRATNEKIVTIGMRGDGDEPMSRETATSLLERIVKDQRQIIAEVTGKPADQTPQIWALYKEVQDYYDKGMRVPDDVTLLISDDNWGNIRRLPNPKDKKRKGGYGIYYHFDYVGGPRNYKWINTNQIPRIFEQMRLAWEYDARQIWIVNVGDLKPMELPISFFLDYAWNPTRIQHVQLQAYTEKWTADQFGQHQSKEIASILWDYMRYSSRRKPELLDASTYSITNYNELDKVTNEWSALLEKTQKLNVQIPEDMRDAFFQLVYHPVKAFANLQFMYTAVAKNKMYAALKAQEANEQADLAKKFYEQDSLITLEYHRINNGKWNHMMSQTHIGYTYWQQPPFNRMPAVQYVPKDSIQPLIPAVPASSLTAENKVSRSIYANVFYEKDGYVSIEAAHFTKAFKAKGISWQILPGLGRTGDAVTVYPVTAASQQPGKGTPFLEYDFYTYSKGGAQVKTLFSPTLNLFNNGGLRYAVSMDDEEPQIISINSDDNNARVWNQWVANNIIVKTSSHQLEQEGKHTLRIWMVDPAVVLQKIMIDLGGLKPSYLGPEETKIK